MKAGITGHQDLGDAAAIAWVRKEILRALDAHAIDHGFTSLAAGADQLFAQALLDRGIPYTVVVPSAGYELAFKDAAGRGEYARFLGRAERCIALEFESPGEEAYWAAGQEIVRLADLLIAVWNGAPAAGLGGTGDVVRHARQTGRKVWHLNPVTRVAGWLHDAERR
jgi:hypothetical protein